MLGRPRGMVVQDGRGFRRVGEISNSTILYSTVAVKSILTLRKRVWIPRLHQPEGIHFRSDVVHDRCVLGYAFVHRSRLRGWNRPRIHYGEVHMKREDQTPFWITVGIAIGAFLLVLAA